MPATSDHSTDDSPAESYPAESWMAERCVLFGERSPATPKVQLSPGWYSTPPEKVPTRPPRSAKADPGGAGVDSSTVMSATVKRDQLSPRSNVASIESETLPERGFPGVDAALFMLTSSEIPAAREEADTPSASRISTLDPGRVCTRRLDRQFVLDAIEVQVGLRPIRSRSRSDAHL